MSRLSPEAHPDSAAYVQRLTFGDPGVGEAQLGLRPRSGLAGGHCMALTLARVEAIDGLTQGSALGDDLTLHEIWSKMCDMGLLARGQTHPGRAPGDPGQGDRTEHLATLWILRGESDQRSRDSQL